MKMGLLHWKSSTSTMARMQWYAVLTASFRDADMMLIRDQSTARLIPRIIHTLVATIGQVGQVVGTLLDLAVREVPTASVSYHTRITKRPSVLFRSLQTR